jgi:hypothetical protein
VGHNFTPQIFSQPLGPTGVIEMTMGQKKIFDRSPLRQAVSDIGFEFSMSVSASGVDQGRLIAETHQVTARITGAG